MDIFGTDKSAHHNGTSGADSIGARGGADRVDGRGGNDTIRGGDGHDTLLGGSGNDVIYGHSAADAKNNAGQITATLLTNIGGGAVSVVTAPGDDGFVFGLNKGSGVISRIDLATGAKTTFLDLPQNEFNGDGERGVLNVAFHPDYASNGRFFVYLTNSDGDIEVREYQRSGNPVVANATMVQMIITIEHSEFGNHNGGAMEFGPDGLLYLGIGDGGDGNDPHGNAQNTGVLLGKILRLDVDHDDFGGAERNYAIPVDNAFVGEAGADEIYAYGLRNPWRFSFDPATGDLYIGDVGQDAREEVDYIAAGTPAGLNFGWDFREGTIPGPSGGGGGPYEEPIIDYDRDVGQVITGGVVYRGAGGLAGAYFYVDFSSGRMFTLRMVDGSVEDAIERTAQINGANIDNITSFGTDASGRMYVVTIGGDIVRLTPSSTAGDGNDSIRGGDGNDNMFGGAGADTIRGDGGNDTLSGGTSDDTLNGGNGHDVASYAEKTEAVVVALNGAGSATVEVNGVVEDTIRQVEGVIGGSAGDSLTGDDAYNILTGGKGRDMLVGKDGRDTIEGGRGNDTVTGGSGADRFVFRDLSGADQITDFGRGDDRLILYRSIFTELDRDSDGTIANAQFHASRAGVAHDRNDRLIYDTTDGHLYYDRDGNRAGAAVHIATLVDHPTLTSGDVFVIV